MKDGGGGHAEAEADSGVPSPELVGMVQRRTTVVAAQRRASITPEEPKGRRASTSSRRWCASHYNNACYMVSNYSLLGFCDYGFSAGFFFGGFSGTQGS